MKEREQLVAHQRLFGKDLPHMRIIVQRKPRTFGIAKFTETMAKCLGCGIGLPPPKAGAKACCANCNLDDLKAKLATEHAARVQKSTEAWDVCRACQGGGFGKVTCSNMTCEQFFYRDRTLIDIEDIEKDIKRLL